MPIDQSVIKEFDTSIDKLLDIRMWLTKLQADSDFITLVNRPVMGLLTLAVDYLMTNLNDLKGKYIARAGA